MLAFLRRLIPKSRTHYVGDGFEITIRQRFRECVDIAHIRGTRNLTFGGERYEKHWRNIGITVPRTVSDVDVAQLVSDLSEGLTALGYGYEIYRAGEPLVIPEEERQSAMESLRGMGMEASVSGNQVKLTKLPNFSLAGMEKKDVIAQGIRMMDLARTASGHRTPMTLLAKRNVERS